MPSCHDHLPPVDLTQVSATSILAGEHEVILQVLAALEAMAVRSAAGTLPVADAKDALDVLRTFADKCHHGKEEEILFPALEAQVPGFGPTQVMRAEHVEGRGLIRAMGEAVEHADAAGFSRAAHGYVDLLRNHIAKENDILFRIAQSMLSSEQDAAILDAYRRIEHDDMGDGTHFRMLATADRLAGAYGITRASDNPQTMALLTAVCGCKHNHA
jgi:hemerythrin-like domain-containing protein